MKCTNFILTITAALLLRNFLKPGSISLISHARAPTIMHQLGQGDAAINMRVAAIGNNPIDVEGSGTLFGKSYALPVVIKKN